MPKGALGFISNSNSLDRWTQRAGHFRSVFLFYIYAFILYIFVYIFIYVQYVQIIINIVIARVLFMGTLGTNGHDGRKEVCLCFNDG